MLIQECEDDFKKREQSVGSKAIETRVLGADVGPKEDEQELTCHRSG